MIFAFEAFLDIWTTLCVLSFIYFAAKLEEKWKIRRQLLEEPLVLPSETPLSQNVVITSGAESQSSSGQFFREASMSSMTIPGEISSPTSEASVVSYPKVNFRIDEVDAISSIELNSKSPFFQASSNNSSLSSLQPTCQVSKRYFSVPINLRKKNAKKKKNRLNHPDNKVQ